MVASFIVNLCTPHIMSNRLSPLLQSLGTLVRTDCKFQEKSGIHSLNDDCICCMRNKSVSFQSEYIVIKRGSYQARQPFKQGRD